MEPYKNSYEEKAESKGAGSLTKACSLVTLNYRDTGGIGQLLLLAHLSLQTTLSAKEGQLASHPEEQKSKAMAISI